MFFLRPYVKVQKNEHESIFKILVFRTLLLVEQNITSLAPKRCHYCTAVAVKKISKKGETLQCRDASCTYSSPISRHPEISRAVSRQKPRRSAPNARDGMPGQLESSRLVSCVPARSSPARALSSRSALPDNFNVSMHLAEQ